MNKIFFLLNAGPYIDKDIFNACAAIAAAALLLGFVLTMVKVLLDYRIKTKLTDSGLPDTVISGLLGSKQHADKLAAAKWALIFAGTGLACTIIYYTLPLGMHSLAIMAFCLSLTFAGYFLVLHKMDKK